MTSAGGDGDLMFYPVSCSNSIERGGGLGGLLGSASGAYCNFAQTRTVTYPRRCL